MVHPTNHISQISNLHCDSSMILLNLYGISVNSRLYPFLSYTVHPTKFLASVGLAQALPIKAHNIILYCSIVTILIIVCLLIVTQQLPYHYIIQ